ncbi:hypothetical protein EON23_13405, partial [Listeria monocytogenes]|nr:hypothetical protein [Listeria monocytogenes]
FHDRAYNKLYSYFCQTCRDKKTIHFTITGKKPCRNRSELLKAPKKPSTFTVKGLLFELFIFFHIES